MPQATLNGHQHYWEDAGSGPVLVMIHGAARSGRMLISHLAPLSRHYRVIIPDLRTMGRSAHVPSIPPSAWIDDLAALLRHLSITSAHLYGVSLGARVVLRTAIDHPSIVRSLILDAPIVANESEGNAALNANIGGFDSMPADQRADREASHGADWREVMRNYMNIRSDPGLQEHLNLRELAKQVQTPALIMRGDVLEPVHPLAHACELRGSLRNSHLWIRPRTAHTVINAAPEEAYAQIAAFISAVESA
jgi:pimeloyl-ACP methyl ester carboxylesterase